MCEFPDCKETNACAHYCKKHHSIICTGRISNLSYVNTIDQTARELSDRFNLPYYACLDNLTKLISSFN